MTCTVNATCTKNKEKGNRISNKTIALDYQRIYLNLILKDMATNPNWTWLTKNLSPQLMVGSESLIGDE